jgi:uncharacterized membrane protein YqaE (UPF0057 family)
VMIPLGFANDSNIGPISLLLFLVPALLLVISVIVRNRGIKNKGDLICLKCGAIGLPKSVIKGSFVIEVLLWLFMLLPGMIYTVWRITSRTQVCKSCGSENLVPLCSPMARKLVKELYPPS